MEYRLKKRVEAVQWFKMGDHPAVEKRAQSYIGDSKCKECHKPLNDHGVVCTFDIDRRVCPGDWVVTFDGEHHRVKPKKFEETYESSYAGPGRNELLEALRSAVVDCKNAQVFTARTGDAHDPMACVECDVRHRCLVRRLIHASDRELTET